MAMIWTRLVLAVVAVALVAAGDATTERFRKEPPVLFECPFAYGIYSNPINCHNFYTCTNFVPYDSPCPKTMYFDDAKKICVYMSEDYVCGPVEVGDPIATDCYPPRCFTPDCFCSKDGTLIPDNLFPEDTPQMIILAFSGALHVLNAEPFGYLLNDTKKNPNGCPIKATFFVPHEHTSYYYVQKLYGQGHEIGMQTITNRPEEFWPTASTDDWVEEVVGMKEILHTFANISGRDLRGVRAPFLKPGGNNMMSMIDYYRLEYDSSLTVPLSEVPLWPYTLNYRIPHKCISGNCPTSPFSRRWEIPLNTMEKNDGTGGSCVLLDQCKFPDDAETIFDFLYHNFHRHYDTNKAPFLLNLNVNWVTDNSKVFALDVFIDHILENYPDAWFVTMHQAVVWMSNPVRSKFIQNFKGWKCPRTRKPGCNIPRTCAVEMADDPSDIRYIQLCGRCPARYPWLNNSRGTIEGRTVPELAREWPYLA